MTHSCFLTCKEVASTVQEFLIHQRILPICLPLQETNNPLLLLLLQQRRSLSQNLMKQPMKTRGLGFFSDLSEEISCCLQLRGRSVRFLVALLHKQDATSQSAGPT